MREGPDRRVSGGFAPSCRPIFIDTHALSKSISHRRADCGANERAGSEIRKPVDCHRDPQADIKGIEQGNAPGRPAARIERPYRCGHCKGDRGV